MASREEIDKLVEELTAAKRIYYTTGESLMLDEVYTAKEDKLRELDPDNHFFEIVGSDFIPDKEKLDLQYRAYSTDKSLTVEELQSYWNRVQGFKDIILSNKVDGLAVDLVYNKGKLITAATRGNGYFGRLFTSKTHYMLDEEIPKYLKEQFSGRLRGEMFLKYEAFEELNRILLSGGEEKQDNCRNSAAGLINADVNNILNKEKKLALLSFRVYGVYEEDNTDEYGSYSTYEEQLEKARELGFKTVHFFHIHQRSSFEDNLEEIEKWLKDLDYPNDGLVLRLNDQQEARQLGEGKNYLNAVTAYKFEPEMALVKVVDIEWQQGSLEYTPVIVIVPVELDGALIKRVGGHSVKNLIDLEAWPGNQITITRSGGVIPRAYHRSLYAELTGVA